MVKDVKLNTKYLYLENSPKWIGILVFTYKADNGDYIYNYRHLGNNGEFFSGAWVKKGTMPFWRDYMTEFTPLMEILYG